MKRTLVIAALLLVLYPLAAAQTPRPDLATGPLDLQGTPAWHGGVPTTVRVEVAVRNLGDAPSSYSLSWDWQKGTQVMPLAGTHQASSDAGTLAPGQTQVHGIDWTPSAGQEGDGAVVATVAAANRDNNRANDRSVLEVRVERHALSASWIPGRLVMRPDETRYARLLVQNDGSSDETLHLHETMGLGGSFTASLQPSSVTVPPGAARELLLYLTMPFKPSLPPPADVRLGLRSEGTSLLTPALRVEAVETALPEGSLKTTLQGESGRAFRHGDPFTISTMLRNTGTEPNSYHLTVKEPDAWVLEVVPTHLHLEPGANAPVLLRGRILGNEIPGTQRDLLLSAQSDRGHAGDAQVTLAAYVHGPRMAITEVLVQEPLYRGDPLQVRTRIENRGTQASPQGSLTLTPTPRLADDPLQVPVESVPAGGSLVVEASLTASHAPLLLRPAAFAWADVNRDGKLTFNPIGLLDADGDRKPDANETLYVAQFPHAASQGFFHPLGGGNVSTGDIRLLTEFFFGKPPGSRVGADAKTNPDLAAGPLVSVPAQAISCLAPNPSAPCAADALLALDMDLNGTLDAGDIWLTTGQLPPPSGPRLIGPVAEVGSQTFADHNGNGVFDPGDSFYVEGVGPGTGDLLRLTAAGFPDGQFVHGQADTGPRKPAPHVAVCWRDLDGDGEVDAEEGLYLQAARCGARSLRASDIRLAGLNWTVPSPVWPGDPDVGRDTVALPAGTAFFLADFDGDQRRGEPDGWVIHDPGLGPLLGPGDAFVGGPISGRIVKHPAMPESGSRVQSLDPQVGTALSRNGLENAALAFIDGDGDGVLGVAGTLVAGDLAFLDVDGNGVSSPGDLRWQCLPVVRPYGGAPSCGPRATSFGSQLLPGHADSGLPLMPLGAKVVDGVLGTIELNVTWTPHGAAHPTWAEATAFARNPGLRLSSPTPATAFPGSTVDYSVRPAAFALLNNGTTREEILLQLHAGQGNATLLIPQQIWLDPGQSYTVPVRHTLPIPSQPGVTHVTLTASLVGHPTTRVQALLDVEVIDLRDPEVSVAAPTLWDAQRPLPIEAQASDDTRIDQVWVHAEGDTGPYTGLAVADASGRFKADLPLPPGSYAVRAEAIDSANRSATSQVIAVEVTQVPAPSLQVLSPDPAATMDGPFEVRVAIVDALAPHKASVAVDSGNATPVEVTDGVAVARLPALAPGPHTVRVTVENAAGRAAQVEISVQVPLPAEAVQRTPEQAPGLPLGILLVALLAVLAPGRRRVK